MQNSIHQQFIAISALTAALLSSFSVSAAPEGHPPSSRHVKTQQVQTKRWLDNAHNHARYYPTTGLRVHALPARTPPLHWRGSNYWFVSGVWYSASPTGYVVVRPPYGVVVHDLPAFRTVVLIGGLTYLYLNGIYYLERPSVGYEVVPSPVASIGTTSGATGRLYVYPAKGQSAETQATDEYECHRWAVMQSGFDPMPAAAGQSTDDTHRGDYVRAQTACLEGRGYTVR